MILEFKYFTGDSVRNLITHSDPEGNVVRVNSSGKVMKTSEDNEMITVAWDSETFGQPVTTTVHKGTLRPLYIPPDLSQKV